MTTDGGEDLPTIIDLNFVGQHGVVAAFLLRSRLGNALIEVGPSSTADALFQGLEQAGVALDDITHLLVTHIHLDHAGAAGLLLQRMPNATLYAHEVGVPHLIDPEKLVASANRIYGALMKKLWGDIVPVPPDRVVPLHDLDTLQVAGRTLRVLYTPGHASHHVAFYDARASIVYAGDVAGVRMQGCSYVRPPTPPPDLDLDAWDTSIERLAALNAATLYLTHFGPADHVDVHLDQLRRRLRTWEALVLAGMRAGLDRAAIALTLQRAGDEELSRLVAPDVIRGYETASSYAMNVSGYERYLRKRHPELAMPATSL